MSLIGDLPIGAQALDLQQTGVEIAGKNLANSTNPAYSRERVVFGDNGTIQTPNGPQSMGVQAAGVQQIRSSMLDTQVTREISQTQLLQAQQDNLTTAQADLGVTVNLSTDSSSIGSATATTTGISSALNNFFNSFQSLSANPTDTGTKQVLLQQAGTLTNQMNVADSNLATLQSDITSQASSDVSTVNGLLSDIGTLNNQIQKSEINAPGSAVDLRDQRQAKLEQLAQYMNFSSQEVPGTNGQIQITALDSSSNPVVLLSKTNAATISFDGTNLTTGNPPATLALQGGSIQGELTARDGAIQQLRNNLRTTANQLATAVNAAYNPTGATGNFFEVPPSSGIIAIDPSVSVDTLKTTDTGNAGANELALAVAQVQNTSFSTANGDQINGTISGYLASGVSGFGASLSSVTSQLDDQNTVQQMVESQRDSVSGVNEDDEMTDLMKYQRAFQASSQVINIVDNLLDVVVNGLVKN